MAHRACGSVALVWSVSVCLTIGAVAQAAPDVASQPKALAEPVVDTVVTKYYDGTTQERYTAYRNKKKASVIHGIYTMWNEDGVRVLECEYRHGKRQGPYRSYHKNGNLEMECVYVDDVQDGGAVWYYETGEKLREEQWVKGVKSGKETQFYESGKIKFEGQYLDGLPHGPFSRFFPNGDHEARGEYVRGKLVNEVKEFKVRN